MALMEPTMVLGGVLIHVGRDLGCGWQGLFVFFCFFFRFGFGYGAVFYFYLRVNL
jgi:hypothetical protein